MAVNRVIRRGRKALPKIRVLYVFFYTALSLYCHGWVFGSAFQKRKNLNFFLFELIFFNIFKLF
jgi:hypothetical protein